MTLNMFIDTNVFLSFYSISDDDIEQLKKIVRLINDGEVKILINSQVYREVMRNRDNKLATALNEFSKYSFKPPTTPRFMHGYEEVELMHKALSTAETAHKQALRRARSEAEKLLTNADVLIEQIFRASKIQSFSSDVYNSAVKRMNLGDPPGKDASLGDRINWEHLLDFRAISGDLHIITRDNDYRSPLQIDLPNHALSREWSEMKGGQLYLHRDIKKFLSSKFSDFDFKSPSKADYQQAAAKKLIEAAAAARSAAWHEDFRFNLSMISETEELEDFNQALDFMKEHSYSLSVNDYVAMCDAAANNTSLDHFGSDGHVQAFFLQAVMKSNHMLSKETIQNLNLCLGFDFTPDVTDDEIDPLAPDYHELYMAGIEEQADEIDTDIEEIEPAVRRPFVE